MLLALFATLAAETAGRSLLLRWRAARYEAAKAAQRATLRRAEGWSERPSAPPKAASAAAAPRPVALCYWGMTRSTSLVYASHLARVHGVLHAAQLPLRVFLHTWTTASGAQHAWGETLRAPINTSELLLLKPHVWRRDSQDEFLASIRRADYMYAFPPMGVEWIPALTLNHLCALESQEME